MQLGLTRLPANMGRNCPYLLLRLTQACKQSLLDSYDELEASAAARHSVLAFARPRRTAHVVMSVDYVIGRLKLVRLALSVNSIVVAATLPLLAFQASPRIWSVDDGYCHGRCRTNTTCRAT